MATVTLAPVTTSEMVSAPIVIDVGKKKKLIRALKRGRGSLMVDVARVVGEVRTNLGPEAASKQLIPVVIIYRQKRKRRGGWLPLGV